MVLETIPLHLVFKSNEIEFEFFSHRYEDLRVLQQDDKYSNDLDLG